MTKHSPPRKYKLLAQYYDQFFNFHHNWFRTARRHILRKVLPAVGSACDLACGTGATALELAERGLNVLAVDISPMMCRLTREKARRLRVPLRVIRADMREFRLPHPVDLITCEFDAVNHIPHKRDLARVARAAARALRPGGYFFFDVNNRLAFEKIWPGTWWIEKPGIVLVMRGGYDKRLDQGWTCAEWFLREGRLWRRLHERVQQVCWDEHEVRRSLRQGGFRSIEAWDATPFFRGDQRIQPGCRTFYLAQKPASNRDGR